MQKGKIKALLFIIAFLAVMATAITLLLNMERERKAVESLGYDPYAVTAAPTLVQIFTISFLLCHLTLVRRHRRCRNRAARRCRSRN